MKCNVACMYTQTFPWHICNVTWTMSGTGSYKTSYTCPMPRTSRTLQARVWVMGRMTDGREHGWWAEQYMMMSVWYWLCFEKWVHSVMIIHMATPLSNRSTSHICTYKFPHMSSHEWHLRHTTDVHDALFVCRHRNIYIYIYIYIMLIYYTTSHTMMLHSA